MWYEYAGYGKTDQEAGLQNILVTNYYINLNPKRAVYLDAVNLISKLIQRAFINLRNTAAGTERQAFSAGCHLEITTLVIPDRNDSQDEIGALARWIAHLDPEIPLHLSRYFPNYKMDTPPTPIETMLLAKKAASRHLRHVFLGNV